MTSGKILKPEIIYWVLDATDGYFKKCIPAFASTMYYNGSGYLYVIYTVRPLTELQNKYIDTFKRMFGVRIFIKPIPAFIKKMDAGYMYKSAVWARFFCPHESQRDCLYLDTDVISFAPFETEDYSSKSVYAVSEYDLSTSADTSRFNGRRGSDYRRRRLAFRTAYDIDISSYYCAGVLFFKGGSMTSDRLMRIFDCASRRRCLMSDPVTKWAAWLNDQDALNVVFHNDIAPFPVDVVVNNWGCDHGDIHSKIVHCIFKPWDKKCSYNKIFKQWQDMVAQQVVS